MLSILIFHVFQNIPDVPTMPDSPATDLARSLATIHQICVTHKEELNSLSKIKVRFVYFFSHCLNCRNG